MNHERVLYVDLYSRPLTYQRAATRISGRALALIVGLLVLLTRAGLLHLAQASTAAGLRYALVVRQREEARLQEEIILLRCQVAQHESIASLQERAGKLGLVDASPNDPQIVCSIPAGPGEDYPATATAATGSGRAAAAPTPLEWLLQQLVPGPSWAWPKP